MKAKLTFDLSDFDDRVKHNQCVNASKMANILFDFSFNMRKMFTHRIDANNYETQYDLLEDIYRVLFATYDEYGINVEDLNK